MNKLIAKKIRKTVYEDLYSGPENRMYKDGMEVIKNGKIKHVRGGLFAIGKRAEYQRAKKAYLRGSYDPIY